MKLFKFVFTVLLTSLLFTTNAQNSGMHHQDHQAVAVADASNTQTETFQVLGNCNMCKHTIEKASTQEGITSADWDAEKDLLTVTFDPTRTSVDAIQETVARSGYDNAGYKAPDVAYNNLPACCQYDRSGAPVNAKSCDMQGEGHKH